MADTAPPPAATIEINDAMFYTHWGGCEWESSLPCCTDRNFDGRGEHDAFFGFDPIDREGIDAPSATSTKDGVYRCKKHAFAGECLDPLFCVLPYCFVPCNQCYGCKKQITRVRAAAKKAGK
ncbi:hypothetical protein B0H13DRAFT_1637653 [Mycena leptocephala]|nr:hypothetical protein B0H13DRAFT_1637653 [Mycena leptocephala]